MHACHMSTCLTNSPIIPAGIVILLEVLCVRVLKGLHCRQVSDFKV